MTQASRPQADSAPTYPDAGPYSRDQWAERIYAVYTGDENTAGQRTKLRGVVPTFDNMLVVTNPAGVTIRVGTGAGISGGSFLFNSAAVDFTPTTPIADRIDRVVIVENNTNAAYNTGLEFPADLTDYALAASVPAYSARLAILIGTPGGAATALVQTANYWMVQLAEYTISNVPAVSGLTDSREFMGIETVVSTVAADNDAIQDALILGVEVNDGVGAADLGVGIKFRLESSAGTAEDAGQLAVRYTDAAAADETRLELRLKAGGADNLSAVINAPSAASVDGNARGVGSVDLQQNRSAVTQVASGIYAFVEGYRNTASGDYAHAEGSSNTASGNYSHAEGSGSDASDTYSHAEGRNTAASGEAAHAEGTGTVASGSNAHAEGSGSRAGGDVSHAEGSGCYATGELSHAGGKYAFATKPAQFSRASNGFDPANETAQYSDYHLVRAVTHSNANWYEIYLTGVLPAQLTVAADQVMTYDCLIVGTTQGCTKSFAFRIVGIIENDGGTTSVLATTTTTIYDADDVSFDARVDSATCAAADALIVEVSDSDGAGDVVRWSAVVRCAEVVFPA